VKGFICRDCANSCELSELYADGVLAGRWGSRCGKWADLERRQPESVQEKTRAFT
jgi:hypothetical protein